MIKMFLSKVSGIIIMMLLIFTATTLLENHTLLTQDTIFLIVFPVSAAIAVFIMETLESNSTIFERMMCSFIVALMMLILIVLDI